MLMLSTDSLASVLSCSEAWRCEPDEESETDVAREIHALTLSSHSVLTGAVTRPT